MQSKLAKIGASFRNVGSFGAAGGGFAGIQRLLVGAGAGAALLWPVKLAANLQSATAQFETFTGSADETKRILTSLEKFATVSPYSVETLQEATRTMLGFGVEAGKVIPIVQNLAEVAAGDSEKLSRLALAFGQVQAKGRLMAQEVLQMVEAGFNPLQEISRTTGEDMKSLAKRMESGGIAAGEVAEAFQSATSEGGRFHGLLKRVNGTADGLWARFKAGIALAVRPFGQALLPMFTGFLQAMNDAVPYVANFVRENASLATTVFWTITAIVGGAAALLTIGAAFGLASMAVGGFVSAFAAVSAVIGAMLSPIGLAVTALAALGYWFATSTEMGRTYMAGLFETVTATFGGMADALMAGDVQQAGEVLWAGLQLLWLQGTQGIRETWHNALAGIANVWHSVWGGMLLGVNAVWGMVERSWSHTVEFFASTIDNVGVWFANVWTDIVSATLRATNRVIALFQKMALKIREYTIDIGGSNEVYINKVEKDVAAKNADIVAKAEEEKGNRSGAAAARSAAREAAAEADRNRSRQTDAGAAGIIGGDMNAADSAANKEAQAAIDAARAKVDAAKAAAASSREEAKAAAAEAQAKIDAQATFERDRLDPAIANAGEMAGVGSGGKAIATLDASFASQQFGGRSREVDLLTSIDKNGAKLLERMTFEGGIPGGPG
ncbi:tape measure protein [Lacipirellula parvula]|nr:tape measure protein [Lacipirellula parvula]